MTLTPALLKGSHGVRFAVIENELGAVGIDAELAAAATADSGGGGGGGSGGTVLVQEHSVVPDLVELSNGCICCTIRADLAAALKALAKKAPQLDAVLIETTGMADPGCA
eukprot:SAG11_NODE_825_length_6992_cov_2.298564_4_plen_110_part_00